MIRVLWDEPKRLANRDKHQLDFAVLDVQFFNAAVIRPAKLGRLIAIGLNQGRIISVIFTPLGNEGLSVISMRVADPQERKLFDEQR